MQTDGRANTTPNSQCVASHVPVSAACAASPALWAEMRYVRARSAAVRWQRKIVRSATRRSCRGCVGLRRRTRPRHAVPHECMRGVCDDAGGSERRACGRSARDAAAPMRRPRLRHRRVVRAELVACFCDLARRLPTAIGVCGRRPGLRAARRYPRLFVMRGSAPPPSSSAPALIKP